MTTHEHAQIPTPDGRMPAHVWLPDGEGPHPAIVVLQEIFGVSDYIQSRCHDLARAGYLVVAPQLYWRLPDVDIPEIGIDGDVQSALPKAMDATGRLDWSHAVSDAVSALEWASTRTDTQSVAVLGFCFGGGLAFNVAAQADPTALVSYYGSALPALTELAPQVTCPSLHHFGDADSYIDQPTQKQVRAALEAGPAEVEWHDYAGADHAFDNPHPAFHHAAASQHAWERTLEFLARVC